MPKVTQNRVYNADGSIVQLDNTPESYVGFLSKFNSLRYVQATVKEPVANEDGTPKLDEKGKQVFVVKPLHNEDGTPKMIARPRSGYTQYFNNDGFTNPISPEALTPQGIGKLGAKLIEVAHMIKRQGGARAEEMDRVLQGLFAYHAIADVEVSKQADNADMDEALKVLTKAAKGDAAVASAKLADFLKSKGINAPAPTVAEVTEVALLEPSVTVEEAVDAAAEAEEVSQDTLSNEAEAEEAVEALVHGDEAAAEAAVSEETTDGESPETEPQAVDETLTVETPKA